MDVKNLQHKLNQLYNIDNWKEIVQFVFPNVSLLESPIEIYNESQKITKFIQFGNVRLSDGKVLALFEIKLADGVNLQRNRVELNNEVSKHIDQEQIHGVLSVFDQGKDDYRFTFSARSSEFDEEEGDFVAIKTDTKRYTYVLGKNESCKTPAKRFFELSQNKENVEIGDLQKAFSVEKLSKEFFDKYKFQFEKFWNYINSHEEYRKLFLDNDKDKQIRDFTKKLLGRVVFLHFLQKKGWMGCDINSANWENGEKQFMQKLFDGFSDKTHFHSKCLHQLFFNTLNNNKRENFIFQCEGVSDELNNTKIPYLNGGLFDADKDISEQIDFPEGYFIDLLDLFSQYNFTIDENDPNDHEVGIDPEMLGHIFENLLEDNKDKGAFYTPKIIVQYMCQESLIEYLATKLNASPDTDLKIAIEDLVRNRLAQGINDLDQVEAIAQALHIVKICDPAIGSGAFPMGILNEIFKIVDDLYHLQPDVVAPIWDINSEIWEPNVVKKSIIQNSIYGVDLESGAVDIARLRFWLALIVDETEPLPLPNLDYKIMQGNSLLESYEGIDLSKIADVEAYEEFVSNEQIDMFTGEVKKKIKTSVKVEDIQQLIHEYFSTSDPESKKDIHNRIDEQVFNHIKFQINNFKIDLKNNIDILESKLERDVNAARTEEQKKKIRNNSKTAKDLIKNKTKLSEYVDKDAELNRIIKSNDKPFFLWNLYFKDVFDQGGFDIVIGNPPYINFENLSNDLYKESLKKYKTYTATGDIYYLFTELALELNKEKGITTYIISNKWLRANSGEKLREYLSNERYSLKKLIDFNQYMIFENAIVHSNIIIMRKSQRDNYGIAFQVNGDFNLKKTISKYIDSFGVSFDYYNSEIWNILSMEELTLKKRIETEFTKLADLDIEIKYGIKTGYNDAFIIDEDIKNDLVKKNVTNLNIIKPVVRGRDTRRYFYNNSRLFIINSHNGYNDEARIDVINDYPDIYNHLLKFETKAKNRSDKGSHWTNLRNCAYIDRMESPKIIFSEIVSSPQFYYDESGLLPEATTFMIYGNNLKIITSILNSKLSTYLFKKFYAGGSLVGKYRYKKSFLLNMPIPFDNALKEKELIEDLVDKIQKHHLTSSEKCVYDEQLEKIIEKLYGFTKKELELIKLNY